MKKILPCEYFEAIIGNIKYGNFLDWIKYQCTNELRTFDLEVLMSMSKILFYSFFELLEHVCSLSIFNYWYFTHFKEKCVSTTLPGSFIVVPLLVLYRFICSAAYLFFYSLIRKLLHFSANNTIVITL